MCRVRVLLKISLLTAIFVFFTPLTGAWASSFGCHLHLAPKFLPEARARVVDGWLRRTSRPARERIATLFHLRNATDIRKEQLQAAAFFLTVSRQLSHTRESSAWLRERLGLATAATLTTADTVQGLALELQRTVNQLSTSIGNPATSDLVKKQAAEDAFSWLLGLEDVSMLANINATAESARVYHAVKTPKHHIPSPTTSEPTVYQDDALHLTIPIVECTEDTEAPRLYQEAITLRWTLDLLNRYQHRVSVFSTIRAHLPIPEQSENEVRARYATALERLRSLRLPRSAVSSLNKIRSETEQTLRSHGRFLRRSDLRTALADVPSTAAVRKQVFADLRARGRAAVFWLTRLRVDPMWWEDLPLSLLEVESAIHDDTLSLALWLDYKKELARKEAAFSGYDAVLAETQTDSWADVLFDEESIDTLEEPGAPDHDQDHDNNRNESTAANDERVEQARAITASIHKTRSFNAVLSLLKSGEGTASWTAEQIHFAVNRAMILLRRTGTPPVSNSQLYEFRLFLEGVLNRLPEFTFAHLASLAWVAANLNVRSTVFFDRVFSEAHSRAARDATATPKYISLMLLAMAVEGEYRDLRSLRALIGRMNTFPVARLSDVTLTQLYQVRLALDILSLQGFSFSRSLERRVLQMSDSMVPSSSPFQVDMHEVLIAIGIPQYVIEQEKPIGPYLADFVLNDRKIVIEADGPHHYLPGTRILYGVYRLRDRIFTHLEYDTLRIHFADWHACRERHEKMAHVTRALERFVTTK